MYAKALTPILNVSDIVRSFTWFEDLGWKKLWDWGSPPRFGAVGSGECEIFLCQGAQGGRGHGGVKSTFGDEGGETADKGVWMSIFVDDVDAVHRHCLEKEIEIAFPPTDMPWCVREMHVRHFDGHVFRISQGLGEAAEHHHAPLGSLFFSKAGPIGDTDIHAIPAKSIGPAVGFYTQCLGFSLVSRDESSARLKRDDVEIGLATNGQDPEQASCWFSVGDVDALWREFAHRGMEPGGIDEQTYDGKPYRVFFAKDPYGVCFCFTQPLDSASTGS